MSTIRIRSIAVGACEVVHEQSGARIQTDLPPEYGGAGRSFSATDLLAAALGVCIATNIDVIATRHQIPLDALEVRVEKTLSQEPKRVASLAVAVTVGVPVPPDVRLRLQRAAEHCTVHRSLHPDVSVVLDFYTPDSSTHHDGRS